MEEKKSPKELIEHIMDRLAESQDILAFVLIVLTVIWGVLSIIQAVMMAMP